MNETKVPRAPRGLKAGGKRLWRELHEDFEFEPTEVVIVEEACRVVDLIDVLAVEIERVGPWVKGAAGQDVANPLIGERRQQQALLHRLLSAITFEPARSGENVVGLASARSVRASVAATARWTRPG